MATCPSIGRANLQAAYVEIEDVAGVLQRPTAAGYILPSGNGEMTQTPEHSNSEELSESLNVLEQFQDATPAGEASLTMLLRTRSGGLAPQGSALLQALMGSLQLGGTVTLSLTANLAADGAQLSAGSLSGGDLPPRGVLAIGDEKILYTSLTVASGVFTIGGLTRGYAGTTAASHSSGDTVTLASPVYMQEVCRPTVSVWMRFDNLVTFMSGCVVTECTAALAKSGGQSLQFSLQGRRMGWCGTGTVSAVSGSTVTVGAKEADGYAVGALLQNKTKSDDNSGAGYTVTAVDASAHKITISPAPSGWAEDDVLVPWLPAAEAIGTPVESRDARVYVSGVLGHRREGELSIGTPTEFASEIGDEYPGENADGKREISLTGGLYFRAEDAKEFGRGYRGYELPVQVVFGNTAGHKLSASMPRVRFNMPEISTDGEFLTLEQDGTALGVSGERGGESALYLVLE